MKEFIVVIILVSYIYNLICAISQFNSSQQSNDMPKLNRKLWWAIFGVVIWLAILLGA